MSNPTLLGRRRDRAEIPFGNAVQPYLFQHSGTEATKRSVGRCRFDQRTETSHRIVPKAGFRIADNYFSGTTYFPIYVKTLVCLATLDHAATHHIPRWGLRVPNHGYVPAILDTRVQRQAEILHLDGINPRILRSENRRIV